MSHDRAPPGLIFCSYHSLVDPSSGAARSTLDLLALLADRGWRCGAVCGPQTDFEHSRPTEDLLRLAGVAYDVRHGQAGGARFTLFHGRVGRVPLTIYRPDGLTGTPTAANRAAFLAVFDRAREQFRPRLLLTYGGGSLGRDLIRLARGRGLRVVFSVRNFAYTDPDLFRSVDAVHVPSATARDHYRETMGLSATVIPGPWDWGRLTCDRVDGRFVTYVNPQPAKGVFVFARVAAELGRRRPDIPFLVVESRGRVGWLGRTGVDLSHVRSVSVMGPTADPREFYRVSKMVLMPSLWRESFARVPVEAIANGIPVIGSLRGGLPETLAEAGVLLDVPDWCTPETRRAPSADEVRPWLEAVERLWDDRTAYEREQARCRLAARAWSTDRLLPPYESFLRAAAAGTAPAPFGTSPARPGQCPEAVAVGAVRPSP